MTAIDDLAVSLGELPEPEVADARHAALLLVDHLVNVVRAGAEPFRGGGLASGLLDRDDVHWGVMVHPGSVIWPVVLELGGDVARCDRLRAAIVGYEAMVRVGEALRPLAADGFHLTSLVGPVGAAAAASVILEGSVNAHALAHALSIAGGSAGALIERSGTRAFHRAHATWAGIAAARAAAAGIGGTRGDLERGSGLLPRFSEAERATLFAAASGLANTSIRVWPTSGWNQGAWEAAGVAAGRLGVRADRATVHVEASVAYASSGVDGDTFSSLEQAVARAVGCDASAVAVSVTEDSGATVTAAADTRHAVASVGAPLGHPSRPLSDAQLDEAWHLDSSAALDLAADWFATATPEAAQRLGDLIGTATSFAKTERTA